MRYRQTLTMTGWIGTAMLVASPASIAYILSFFFAPRGFMGPAQFPLAEIAVVTTAFLIGAVLVAIGREHRPVDVAGEGN